MDSQMLGTVIRRLRAAASQSADAELLRAFTGSQGAAAFAEVVRRHGPMVLGVCRRVLRESADADDAFQATFLVLFRKAGTLRRPERLAGWLHQVALRTSKKLRGLRAARQGRQRELFDVPAGDSPAEFIWRELRPIFDEELNRLPDKLRLPAVLCFLEGCSKSEAARMLGWPEGTLAGRLQRAREWLRSRFTARGLVLSGGALAVALFDAAGPIAVAESLIESTILSTTTASAGVRALAEGVTQAMFLLKVKTVAAATLIAGMVGTGTGLVVVPGSGSGPAVAGEPAKDAPKTPPPIERGKEPKSESGKSGAENERDVLLTELEMLRERLAWQERMVKKGYLAQSATLKSKTEILKAEAALEKLDAAKPPDTRAAEVREKHKQASRTILEDTIKQLEHALKLTEDAFKQGTAAENEVIIARVKLNEYKLKLLELGDSPVRESAQPRVSESRRSELEALVEKLEENVKKIADGVRKGIIPMAELFNAERTLLEYKFKLAELGDAPPRDPRTKVTPPPITADTRKALLEEKEKELARAEQLLKQKVISTEEVRRLRMDLRRAQAEYAEAAGDYDAAVKHREAVLAEFRQILDETRKLVERKAVSQGELREVEIAFGEATIERLRTDIRKQLADIVAIREQELKEAKTLFDLKAISAEELRRAERAVSEAKARLSASR
jgi:RNA polymerase sigma factor (sigma-70 family)